MKVEVTPRATMLELKAQTVEIPAGEAREVAWDVKAPAQLSGTRAEALIWEISARDTAGGADAAQDALKISQRIVPAVPLSVQQATLVQVNGSYSVPVNPPADALPGRGGLQMSLVPKLTEGLPGVRDWWALSLLLPGADHQQGRRHEQRRAVAAPWPSCPTIWTVTAWPATSRPRTDRSAAAAIR
jgi:hypothetical protein